MKNKISFHFYLMILPLVVLFFVLHTFPFLQGLFYSLTNWKGYGPWEFTGLHNYTQMFRDPKIAEAYLFTFKFTICATLLVNILSMSIACGLNAKIKLKNFLRAVYFLPYILGSLVVSYVFKQIFSNIIPVWAKALGIPALSVNILGTNHAWLGILFVTVWQSLAFNTIIYLSGLQSIDPDVYEAASIDGCTGFRTFRKITFPLIAPFFTINMVLCGKGFLMMFDQVLALTNGGPGTTTQTIAVLIYKRGFNGGQFAYQSANAAVLFFVVIGLSLFQMKFLERREKKYE
ncbi:carbohydrate ABC transporter permease [Treponema primitia]|uniref:carbohydrate ABC transporter permease n=1 Tax=Treponema primitia TaxID=88058 RepID=UPI000255506A|nr:sugar ABC transporter permease [Treponema primitia]